MKITASLIDKLIRLRNGESIPASQLRGEWVSELESDGVIVSTSHGSRRVLFVPQPEAFLQALSAFDERLSDLDLMRDTLQTGETSRSVQASATGNSKLIAVRSCPGFPINTYEPIVCLLNGREMIVNPQEGSFMFISDWQSFSIPQDVVVVGIENMENFRLIRQQQTLFERTIDPARLLFVSRYPQSSDLRSWLQTIPNRYVHFGDFDLAGISIFLTEFHAYLGERSSFFIPSDIEQRLPNGSLERYSAQYPKFKNIRTNIPYLQHLIDTINNYHRCYDQEGYINI
ncbi:MAG: hypothetical protein J5952_04460 [Prevotella sp.]|nr:hypothetical protein [Prevotella sp.]